jgi:hypothetical protein
MRRIRQRFGCWICAHSWKHSTYRELRRWLRFSGKTTRGFAPPGLQALRLQAIPGSLRARTCNMWAASRERRGPNAPATVTDDGILARKSGTGAG